MNAIVRRKLAMASQVLEFANAHPDTDPGFLTLVARLKELVARGDAVAEQQVAGRVAAHAAIAQREALRRIIQQEQLHQLVWVAELASKERPDLAGRFTYPAPGGPYQVFSTAAKSMLGAAIPYRELFVSLGLGATLLDDLAHNIDDSDAAIERANGGRRDHVGACADLAVVADDCVKLSRILGGLIRARFRHQPKMLVAWESAANVERRRTKHPAPAAVTPMAAAAPAVAPAVSLWSSPLKWRLPSLTLGTGG